MVTKAGRSRTVVTNIPLIWRLRLVLHGVRLSPFAHEDLSTVTGARLVAYRIRMIENDLIGADAAPIEARVNIRAASFVLRHFGLHVADLRVDALGSLLAIDTRHAELAASRPIARAAGASVSLRN